MLFIRSKEGIVLLKGSAIASMILVLAMTVVQGDGAESIQAVQRRDTKIEKSEEVSDVLVADKGVVEQGHRLDFEGDYAMLSRDGSKAQKVTSGTKITKPGIYFLTSTTKKNQPMITKLTIKAKGWKDTWTIKGENELDEILKAALEGFRTTFSIQFNYGKFTMEEINEILFAHIQKVLAMYPKLTFESYVIKGVLDENPTINIEINYPLKQVEKLKAYDQEADQKIMEILRSEVSVSQEDYEKEWVLFKYLIDSTRYSAQRINNEIHIIDKPMIHTLFGALIDGQAVCDGYAKAMMYLLNIVGIPNHLTFGEADEIAHVWNQVNIQGTYYHLDATWADLEEKQLGGFYNYFNETDKYMLQTHEWEQNLFGACKDETYSLPYLPIEIEGIDKIKEKKEWKQVLNKIKKSNLEEQSLILYNNQENKWDIREMIGELCNTIKQSIEYNVVEKYDTIIINYKRCP